MNKSLCAFLLVCAAWSPVAWSQTAPPDPAGGASVTPAGGGAVTPVPRKAKVAVIKLSDTLLERPQGFGLSLTSLLTSSGAKAPTLSELTVTLQAAARDSSMNGVVLDFSAFSLSLHHAQEIGPLLSNLRKSGKRVAIYASDYDTATYILASHADTVLMPENGEVLIPGTGMQMLFFAGALEKLKLKADFVQVGDFKGASEPFTRKSASPEYRAQIEKLVDGMHSQVVSAIAANRPNLSQDQVKKIIDEGWMTGRRAKALGLVDQTLTRDKLDAWVESQFPAGATLVADYGTTKKPTVDLDSPFAIFSLLGGSAKPSTPRGPAIAVIYATGQIVPDTPGAEDAADLVTPGTIRKAVQNALNDGNVKAIVLRVDSPGGSASASDEIWAILKEADKKKPVTISMGEMAASGGYYIACAGRSIMADPATITGSIGVVGGKVVLTDLLEWAGVNIEPVSRGQHAEMLSLLRPFSDEERVFVRKQMEDIYGVFTSRVTEARGKKIAKLEDVAQGRLFTGQQAKEVGLVDEVGTLNDAIRAAAKTAGLGEIFNIRALPEPKTLSDIIAEGLMADLKTPVIIGGTTPDALEAILNSLPADVREPTRSAMRMLQTMNQERVLMAMPPGLVRMHGPQR